MDVSMLDTSKKKPATTTTSFGPKPVILQHRWGQSSDDVIRVFEAIVEMLLYV
jgi:hypothetical protein